MTMDLLRSLGTRLWSELGYLRLCVSSGLVGIDSPVPLLSAGTAMLRYGGLPALLRLSAGRYGARNALVDELGSLTYRDLDDRSNRLANEWRKRGLRSGEGVAILARNHRGLLDAMFAAAKCGARIILLNTDFAGPQLRDVATREGADLLVYDEEYEPILGDLSPRRGAYRAWTENGHASSIESLIAAGSPAAPPAVGPGSRIILLTSGTTGTPKGAPRSEPRSLEPLGAVLSKVPFRPREVTECPAPLFHSLGFAMSLLAIGFGSTLVIRRRFDPQRVIDSMDQRRATSLIAVPVMLARMAELGPQALTGRDLSRLRVILVAGAQLGADLCRRATIMFGPVVYNLYGSTEVAYATVATPGDLAAEPGCVGKPVLGAVVRVLNADGAQAPAGVTGRVFVGNASQFEGYTGGGGRERVDGLMATGDLGHFDSAGRLFIDGRDDDMIVSGGENVFPGEVEELLNAHRRIREAAVIGVPDREFGARLKAFVVREDETLSADDVRAYVKATLARYKVPRDVVFLGELPRNPTGKVLGRLLREL
ncbi:AMP-binding protein [Nocardia sp. BMG51109]|uniref:AMP-binding protein n=1 Tax=Nocardia sp. BMG51109 TaxID=1056816 RepID=UPI0004B1C7D0|nr:AMP-binding protein [Nocardia sp. BMG51109]